MINYIRSIVSSLFAVLIIFAACGRAPKAVEGIAPEPQVLGEPIQSSANTAAFTLHRDDYDFTITPVASYEIQAEVVSTKRYRSGWNALLSPVDLALAWGEITKPEAIKHISFSQSNRWYHFYYDGESFYDVAFVSRHSANVHILPANENIKDAALSISEGDHIKLTGYLVNVDGKRANGQTVWWRSSQSRDDTGDGSCEVMWVTEIQNGATIYR